MVLLSTHPRPLRVRGLRALLLGMLLAALLAVGLPLAAQEAAKGTVESGKASTESGKASAEAAKGSASGSATAPAKPTEPVVYKAPKVTEDELKVILENEKGDFLLDVRRPEELAQLGTLKGYVNIPLEELESRLGEIPKEARILSLCNTGNRAGKAAAILEKHGYTVRAVGGLKGLDAKGWNLIYPEAPAPKPETTAPAETAKKP